ncbi:MAG: peptidylprolyl isomerase [Pseudomonadota bacterium]
MRTVYRIWLWAFAWLALCVPMTTAQTVFKPVAVVNESVITGYDLSQRAQLLATMEARGRSAEQMRRQALESLIVDRLKLQAGSSVGLAPTEEVINLGFDLFAQQNGQQPDELRTRLNGLGISNQAINDFVAAETIWREVVRARFLTRAEPSQTRIDEELRLSADLTNTSYRLKELGVVFTGNQAQDRAKRNQIVELYNQLQFGGDFDAAVREFSETPSAAQGGQLGWVPGSRLPLNLVRDLNRLEAGQITRPLSIQNGLAILQLVERRSDGQTNAVEASAEQREQVRQRLLTEEVTRLAEGYMQEIRRDALIELR